MGQKDILRLLEPGTEGYCYIASMVRCSARRPFFCSNCCLLRCAMPIAVAHSRHLLLASSSFGPPQILTQMLQQVVAPAWRRRGAAAALLAAAEAAVGLWDERQALLHVYQDNIAAVQASHWRMVFLCRAGDTSALKLCWPPHPALPFLAHCSMNLHAPPPATHALVPLQLYQKQGYEVVLQEKKGLAAMGRRPRFLMRKRW